MEDVTHEPPKVPKPKKKTSSPKICPDGALLMAKLEHFVLWSHDRPPMEVDEPSKEKKNPPPKQQSELQQQLNMDDLVKKLLGTATTVTLQELLGASPMASKKIQDYLCVTCLTQHIAAEHVNSLEKSYLHNQANPAALNPQTNCPSYNLLDSWLVNLTVQFKNDHLMNPLIDLRSELDIIGHKTWLNTGEPMDRHTHMLMCNASNHVMNLWGKCFCVELASGNNKSTSDFWVGNVPFEILCGWPWQVRKNWNKVNIEEHNNGTWLSHRSGPGEAVWEVCAVPAQNSIEDGTNSHLFGHHRHHHHPFHHTESCPVIPLEWKKSSWKLFKEDDEIYAYVHMTSQSDSVWNDITDTQISPLIFFIFIFYFFLYHFIDRWA